MKRIIILSVGGSPDPIVNAINFYKPDFVYFFCSSGKTGSDITIEGESRDRSKDPRVECPKCEYEFIIKGPVECPKCKNEFKIKEFKRKSIISQVELSRDQYEIVRVDDPDDFNLCYDKILELSKVIDKRFPDADIKVNYSGGTKTMSTVLAHVAIMTEKWDLSLNKAERRDLVKIRKGDTPVLINKWGIFAEQCMQMVQRALSNYEYPLAAEIISATFLHPFNSSYERKLRKIKEICVAFDSWDKFNHKEALALLEPYGKYYSKYIIRLKKILKDIKGTGYEMVEDLLSNAERRADQGRYDDAVARLYRTLEFFGQIRIEKTQGYELGQICVKQLEDDKLKKKYEKNMDNDGKILLALKKVYEFLFDINDPVGKVYKKHEGPLKDILRHRNASILAHGLTPLKKHDYIKTKEMVVGFIFESAKEINLGIELVQLPRSEIMNL